MNADGLKLDVEAVGLSHYLNDDHFLNQIQSGVNRWIKEIHKITRLSR